MSTDTLLPNPSAAADQGLSLRDLAGAAKSDRNRAIDLYRAVAMIAVAFGHWMAISIGLDDAGELVAGNALEFAPEISWVSWIFQVMPLFFVVGGFSSAMSLDSFTRNADASQVGNRPQDWVAARLRRMLPPAVTLATTWAALLVIGFALGQGAIVGLAATAAAIPLWFLANYTIDTAIAPWVLPAFRRHPVVVPTVGLALFAAIEAARFADVPLIPHLNWVLGWLLFQVAGFAWRDGLLPTGRTMLTIAAGLWTAAILAVTVGPWPVSMVHFPGLENSPTHPPSAALLLFGGAYSATAIAAAPAVSRWLTARPRVWTVVVGANAVAMSVYLWHFTAAIIAGAFFWAAGFLPTAPIASFAWWMQKAPMMALSTIVLALIVKRVAPVEQKALMAARRPWVGGAPSIFVFAALLSTALKQWAHGSVAIAAVSLATVIGLWHFVLKADSVATRLLPRLTSVPE